MVIRYITLSNYAEMCEWLEQYNTEYAHRLSSTENYNMETVGWLRVAAARNKRHKEQYRHAALRPWVPAPPWYGQSTTLEEK
jgi:hypothetical protein